ncbi:hypothetical protein PFICI_06273 [Pestalotiopsis fici W106-1]|uniref:Uncharacterized protein n=1 Tax=Pestalotiopsis fici (strain W106-1 / CGMCC3.15140) TaxID=1229662 RepID=W3X7Y2_PESFW|nr:uncharacterized protein PFICI_06273 [Pestalotiopsis fici W106-1]ETS81271.1 hypothetical protein PFICI_06273 [Pestalotiopsis fici W106-1]
MQAFVQRLANYNVDPQEYMLWSINQGPAKPPKYEPAQVLAMIQQNSVGDFNSMTELSHALGHILQNVILLAQDSKYKFMVGSDDMALSMGPFVPIDDDDDEPQLTTAESATTRGHPLVVELKSQAQDAASRNIPRYVVVLGRLLIHDIRDIGEIPEADRPQTDINPDQRPLQPTNYAVVMDAIAAERSVWLIYNRAPIDPDVGCQVESAPGDPDQPVLFTSGSDFDSAMIMSNVRMWRLESPQLNLADVERTVISTKANSPVVAQPAPDADVRRALNPAQSG